MLVPKAMNIRNVLPMEKQDLKNDRFEWADDPRKRLVVSFAPHLGDYFLSNSRFVTAVKCYEISCPAGSTYASQSNFTVMYGTNKIAAARAAAQASICFDNEFEKVSNDDRQRYRRLAFKWVESEIGICRIASQREGIAGGFATYLDGKSKKEIGINLSLLMLHKELEPIRNPIFINQMSKEDRDRAKKIWDEVRTLYEMTFDTEISQN